MQNRFDGRRIFETAERTELDGRVDTIGIKPFETVDGTQGWGLRVNELALALPDSS